LVLGIGNILWADEGFGVRCVEAMAAAYRFGPNLTLLDGGTQGIYLVDQVRDADVLVVFDAVDYGFPPGTLKCVEGDAVPHFMGAKKMSLHQTGFQEVLAMADLLGDYPEHLLLIGVQPVALEDFGGSLRPEIKSRIAPAIEVALDYLASLGVKPVTDVTPAPSSADLPHPALGLSAYESGRPPPERACRSGDERLLPRRLRPREQRDVRPGPAAVSAKRAF
jgi:hydrogenase maturation protease